MTFKIGDWVVYGLKTGQIKDIRDDGIAEFGDGFTVTSGRLIEDFRPLTLRSKRIVEAIDTYYQRLRDQDGSAGFNFPDINRYFSGLVLYAIDGSDEDDTAYHKANEFLKEAREYHPVIAGVRLFRPR